MSEKIKKHNKPLGASGTDVVGKIHNADDHIEILTGYQAAQIYDKMRRSDTQIRKVLSSINNPIKSAEWDIEPASTDTKDIEAAALIQQILFKDLVWPKFLNEALTCVMHGFSIFEVVHENKENPEMGMYTGLAQLGYRKQTTITEWCHDSTTGKLEKVKQEAFGDIRVSTFLPADTLLIFYNDQEGDNIGFPLGRILYGPYKRKLLATELQYIGIERFAIPTPILKTPKNIVQSDAEYISAVDVLKNFTSAEDSYITYPEGWDLTLHNNVFDPSKIQVVIQAENENMSGSILASFLELGIGGNSGAFALSNDLSDFFLAGLEHFANVIRDTINVCLIPNLIRLNFGDDSVMMPKLKYSGISDKAGKELMEVVTGYSNAGVIRVDEPLEDHIRKVNHLPPKAEGSMIDNQESEDGSADTTQDNSNIVDNVIDNNSNDNNQVLKLADTVGHRHKVAGKFTGPAIERGQKHFHQLLDDDGTVIGRTKTEEFGVGHIHDIDGETKTGKPIETKMEPELKDNPKSLIELEEPRIAKIIRMNLSLISSKYIADIMNNYKRLGDKQKLNAIKGVKVGGVAKFRKELQSAFISIANDSLVQARAEIPSKSNTKLSDDMDAIRLEFTDADNFKFNDFSKLPRRIQILVANQAKLISDKEAGSLADTISLQFNSSEASTDDINVLRDDLTNKAEETIQSGSKDVTSATTTSAIINEARNSFLLDDEVQKDIASYTFVNFDPKAEICKTLAGTTYNVDSTDIVRFQPPLHQNCKSYIRANLKVSKSQPDVTGLPPISKSAEKSITLKDESCHC